MPRAICLHAHSDHKELSSCLISPQLAGHRVKPFLSLAVERVGEVTVADDSLKSSDAGTAIIILMLSGTADFSDSTHKQGRLQKNDVLWILSGAGVEYSLRPTTQDCISVKLRVALSPALESAPAQSIHIDSGLVERDGPAQILLGQHGDACGQLTLPALVNYLAVTLVAGQAWVYHPPVNHRIAWVAVISGKLKTSDRLVVSDETAVFDNSNKSISFVAEEDCVFLLGTAQEHTHQEYTYPEYAYQEHDLAGEQYRCIA